MDMQLLLDGWRGGGPPHRRLDRMLRSIAADDGADEAALGRDTLGMRNQRLLRLHHQFGGGSLEAVARCPSCGTPNEFALPGHLLLALPEPERDVATVDGARFRLPRMDDLLDDDPRPLAERCCETDHRPAPASVARAGEVLNDLDPAANPVFDLTCSACGLACRAAADIAGFVAAAFDHIVGRLMRDIDSLASAYGWSEQSIAALPAERRRRYVEMVAARGGPLR